MSLTSLGKGDAGRTLWSLELPRGNSYLNAHWNERHAYWFDGPSHLVVDTATGRPISRTNVLEGVTLRARNPTTGEYETRTDVDVPSRKRSTHTNQSNIVVGDWHWFLSHGTTAIGRVHVETGRVEYLEVPAGVHRTAGGPDRSWTADDRIAITNTAGVAFATADKRSERSGWGHVSAASPIAVGKYLLFPLMTGTCYVIDSSVETLDERAIVAVNDLGPGGETWSLSSYSFADGSLFARTAKAVISIKAAAARRAVGSRPSPPR